MGRRGRRGGGEEGRRVNGIDFLSSGMLDMSYLIGLTYSHTLNSSLN